MRSARHRWFGIAALALALLSPLPVAAIQPDEVLADPKLEARARELGRELRCMVCQNQSIDDSDAPLARDLRLLVRERLTAGDSNDQVLDFLTARYGPFVLLKPPFEWSTALLWFAPALVLVIGAGALLMMLRRRRAAGPGEIEPAEPALSAAETKRLAELLGKGGGRPAKR
jgi:cytochrome c-type biogenesis protein CcmH